MSLNLIVIAHAPSFQKKVTPMSRFSQSRTITVSKGAVSVLAPKDCSTSVDVLNWTSNRNSGFKVNA